MPSEASLKMAVEFQRKWMGGGGGQSMCNALAALLDQRAEAEREQQVESELSAAREQIRRLREALQRYERDGECDYGGPDEQCPGSPAFTPCRWHQARAALAETAPGGEEVTAKRHVWLIEYLNSDGKWDVCVGSISAIRKYGRVELEDYRRKVLGVKARLRKYIPEAQS